jgi:hypothetical protein
MPLTTVDQGLLSTNAQYTGFKNRLINGDMNITQRGNVNVTAAAGSTYMACDRFTLTNFWGSGQVNTTQSTTAPTGFSNSLSLTVSSTAPMNGSTGYAAAMWQSIEGFNISDCYSSTVTLSFWVRSSITGTYSVTFSNVSSTSLGDGSRIYVSNYTINAANTWEQKTITVNIAAGTASGTWNTTNGAGLCVAWNLGAESNRKGNGALDSWQTLPISGGYPIQSANQVNWLSTPGATFNITGVQLEKGQTATSFDVLDYATELALCQRYYQIGIASSATAQGTTAINGRIQLLQEMRATPSLGKVGTNYNFGDMVSVGFESSAAPTIATYGYQNINVAFNLGSFPASLVAYRSYRHEPSDGGSISGRFSMSAEL